MFTKRAKEIGIRKVVGATALQRVFLLFQKPLGLVIVASLVASVLSYFAVSEWLNSFYYRTDINASSFLIAALVAIGIAFVTVATQSSKTALANPVKSLRYE